MGRLSDSQMNAALDALFGSGTPASHDVALSTTQPNDDGTGVTEPAGGSYGRVNVTNDAGHWPAAAARLKSNGVAITFPAPTGPWGTAGWFVLYEGGSATFAGWGSLAVDRTITAITPAPSFDIGALVINGPA